MVFAALLLSIVEPVTPATESEAFDMRCMMLTMQLAQSDDPDMRQPALMASQFYFGRVNARIVDTELEARLWQVVQEMRGEDAASHLQACGNFMRERGETLIRIGRGITAREQAEQRR